jgi:hypothetical protein
MKFTINTEFQVAFEESHKFGAVEEFAILVNGMKIGWVELFVDVGEQLPVEIFRVAVWIGTDVLDFFIQLAQPSVGEMKLFASNTVEQMLRDEMELHILSEYLQSRQDDCS